MGFKRSEAKIQHLFVQDKVVSQEKNENIQNRVGTPTGSVSKGLDGDQLSKGRIEKVNNGNNFLFWHKSIDSGREVNIIEADSLRNKSYFCAQFNENGACNRYQNG